MVEISFSSSFRRSFKKRIKGNLEIDSKILAKSRAIYYRPIRSKLENSQIVRQAQGSMEF
jgi:mRNA-degrading endonuclease YafQ of YafQ-DinJ toxin-antitoxin module